MAENNRTSPSWAEGTSAARLHAGGGALLDWLGRAGALTPEVVAGPECRAPGPPSERYRRVGGILATDMVAEELRGFVDHLYTGSPRPIDRAWATAGGAAVDGFLTVPESPEAVAAVSRHLDEEHARWSRVPRWKRWWNGIGIGSTAPVPTPVQTPVRLRRELRVGIAMALCALVVTLLLWDDTGSTGGTRPVPSVVPSSTSPRPSTPDHPLFTSPLGVQITLPAPLAPVAPRLAGPGVVDGGAVAGTVPGDVPMRIDVVEVPNAAAQLPAVIAQLLGPTAMVDSQALPSTGRTPDAVAVSYSRQVDGQLMKGRAISRGDVVVVLETGASPVAVASFEFAASSVRFG